VAADLTELRGQVQALTFVALRMEATNVALLQEMSTVRRDLEQMNGRGIPYLGSLGS